MKLLHGGFALLFLFASSAVGASRDSLQPDRLVTYKQVSGVDLQLHIFEPPALEGRKRTAAIVFFFGGGWQSGTPSQFYAQARSLADLGMLAMTAEYRVKKRNGTSPFESVEDAKSAIRWVRRNAQKLGIDPKRIVAAGGSAGGHLAACTGLISGHESPDEDLKVSSQSNAMILFNPVLDTTAKGFGRKHVGADRETEISPCHHVAPGQPKTLVLHGTADNTVPFENAERFVQLMKESGNSARLVAYEGQSHGFFNSFTFRPKRFDRSRYESTLQESIDFLAELGYLQSNPPPATSP